MKFTNEQAVEALRAELTNKGRKSLHMSESTLVGQTEILVRLLANDDMGLPDFVTAAIESLNLYEGDARKKDSVHAKYKEKYPETKEPSTDPEPPKPTESPELKAALERIAALEKKDAEATLRASIAQKRSDLTAKLKEKGVKDEKWLDKYFSKISINANTDVDAEVEDTLSLYNLNKANGGNPVPPANPNGGNTDTALAQSIKAAAALAKKERAMANIESKNQ